MKAQADADGARRARLAKALLDTDLALPWRQGYRRLPHGCSGWQTVDIGGGAASEVPA